MKLYPCIFFTLLFLILFTAFQSPAQDFQPDSRTFDMFPFIMYDLDTGFGGGAKAVFRNYLKKQESFDFVVFASSKGEQWYAFQYSMPDDELRQGKRYTAAFNIKIEWDKFLKSNFFGIGNNSKDNEYQFPREFFKINPVISHTFLPTLVGELGYQFAYYVIYGYDPEWGTITHQTPGAQANTVSLIYGGVRLDTRDSQIHPRRGVRIYFRNGFSRPFMGSDWTYTLYRLESSIYHSLFASRHVIAGRLWTQHIQGTAPYQELSMVGDGWTARGYKADRFLDQAMILTSLEYRFPVYRRLGGVLFADAGRVAPGFSSLRPENWHSNWGWGMRYYLTTFVVRFDMGISPEGLRVFFNFGQVF